MRRNTPMSSNFTVKVMVNLLYFIRNILNKDITCEITYLLFIQILRTYLIVSIIKLESLFVNFHLRIEESVTFSDPIE